MTNLLIEQPLSLEQIEPSITLKAAKDLRAGDLIGVQTVHHINVNAMVLIAFESGQFVLVPPTQQFEVTV